MKISYSFLGGYIDEYPMSCGGGDSGKMYTIITQLYERWICRWFIRNLSLTIGWFNYLCRIL